MGETIRRKLSSPSLRAALRKIMTSALPRMIPHAVDPSRVSSRFFSGLTPSVVSTSSISFCARRKFDCADSPNSPICRLLHRPVERREATLPAIGARGNAELRPSRPICLARKGAVRRTAVIAQWMERVVEVATAGPGMAEAQRAHAVFVERGGAFEDTDPFFEERTQ